MNKITLLAILLLILSNCSSKKNPLNWKNKEKELIEQKNIKKIFVEDKIISTELNPTLKLDLSNIQINDKIKKNSNNYGAQNYQGTLKRIGNFKFSKLNNINHLNYKPVFFDNGLIFFDKKGSIIRFGENKKIIWKKNYYSKNEKKQNPKIYFSIDDENVFVADNISKFYSINLNTGELNWLKNNVYPINSNIRIKKNKIFLIDYSNTLRSFDAKDGSEIWSLQTEESFSISNYKNSLIVNENFVIFSNSVGDITSVDIENGMIIWVLPTQSSSIVNESHNLEISNIISDNKDIFFSTNKNQIYSIEKKTGIVNWTNKINSNIKPIISSNLLFTVTNEGYLAVIEKNKGNIIRTTDLYKNYKEKEKNNLKPIGFVIGNKRLYLTNNDGSIIVADLETGNVVNTEKISRKYISEPFIYNKNLYIIQNGSIIQYN